MSLRSVTEGWAIALDQLGANKLRSGLTILGVVIGVSTVMAMASIVQGIRQQIVNTLEVVGPTTFRILRFFSQTPLNPDALPREVRIRPVLKPEEATALARLPEIHYASIWTQLFERLEYQGVRTQLLAVFGADERFMEILGGGIVVGRPFTTTETRAGAPVVILERAAAERVFGRLDPLHRFVRLGGKPVQVVGLWQKPENIFEPPGQDIGAIVPFETARRSYRYDATNALIILVKPRPGVPLTGAMDAVTVQLRRLRGLKTGQPNSFDLITSDQILNVFDRLTSAFFLVMIALSSVALMVGGIGVMAIMMVSVTDRTREIGVRKALGATRREILWQFLVEAATLTFLGGLLGILIGLTMGESRACRPPRGHPRPHAGRDGHARRRGDPGGGSRTGSPGAGRAGAPQRGAARRPPRQRRGDPRPAGGAPTHAPAARRNPALPCRPAPRPPHRLRGGARRLLSGRAGEIRPPRRRGAPPPVQAPVRPGVPGGPREAVVRRGHLGDLRGQDAGDSLLHLAVRRSEGGRGNPPDRPGSVRADPRASGALRLADPPTLRRAVLHV